MPRETAASLAAAVAPAKKQAEQPTGPTQHSPTGDSSEVVGFGVPPNRDSEVHVVPLQILDAKKRTVANPDCLAKRVSILGPDGELLRYKFYVKVGVSGFPFDPWGSMDEGLQNKFARTHGRPAWDFSEVSDNTFAFYLRYLHTRNKAWYARADRELRHA